MTIQRIPFLFCISCLIACNEPGSKTNVGTEKFISSKPPMGWNSWDCFGTSVTEADVKANADYMAAKLKKYGWDYIVIDLGWYGANLSAYDTSQQYYKRPKPIQLMDSFGRLIPAVNKFPSCINGSFKPLGDWLHAKGLKFGIHVMRGIPWQAVEQNTPIAGTNYRARDIVKLEDGCNWYDGMRGIDFTQPGAQLYYNSLYQLFADWGIDFVKVDDMSAPTYHADDIAAVRKAIDLTGRPMVLSLSPGSTPLVNRAHVQKYANMFRVSEDFWDTWEQLKNQFSLCKKWSLYQQENHWADLDMLPLGKISLRAEEGSARQTNFTRQEQVTLMTMWAIFRSPLMFGGNLPDNDAWTDSLITSEEVIAVNQTGKNARIISSKVLLNDKQMIEDELIPIWSSESEDKKIKYVAFFNLTDKPQTLSLSFEKVDLTNECWVRNLWDRKDIGIVRGKFEQIIQPHAAGLYSVKNVQ